MTISPSSGKPEEAPAKLKPGDAADQGTPGTGEDLCEDCGGSGKRGDGTPCPTCEGSGRVVHGIGGG